VYKTWKYSADSTTNLANSQLFSHFVDVKFVEVLPEALQNDMTTTSGLFPKFPADLFYPLAVQSDTSESTTLQALFALIIASTLVFFF
jgi:hypothetical protein